MCHFLVSIFCASLITLTTLYLHLLGFFLKKPNKKDSPTYHKLLHAMKAVLHPQNTDISTLLRERADSNQRLIRALNLSNTFVSPDPTIHKEFVGQAQYLLSGAKRRGWAYFQGIAVEAVRWQILNSHQSLPDSSEVPFDSFIQNVTLVVVLLGILRVDKPVDSFSQHDVCIVAKQITNLWALSKNPEPISPIHLEQLLDHLRTLVDDEEGFSYPLNFVVPAWETLWRVVATTVAYSFNDTGICTAFRAFNACPSDDTFRGEEIQEIEQQGPHITVKSIVQEAMRLHPPSKRIARVRKRPWYPLLIDRWFRSSLSCLAGKCHADIERLLRCQDVWGPDAEVFNPLRHDSCEPFLVREREESMNFVFGHGPLRCIAASWAPMAAAVISGAIIEELHADEYTLKVGKCIGGRDGWSGWNFKKTLPSV